MKLYINNYKDIKITKIRDGYNGLFCVHFFYEGTHYMLHYNDEETAHTCLYEWNKNELTIISRAYCEVNDLIRYNGKKMVYSKVDLFYFVFMMDYYGLIRSEFNHLVKEWKHKEQSIRGIESLLGSVRRI